VDPKATPWESPYVSMGNNPILNNDVLGDSIGLDNSFKENKTKMKAMEEMLNSKEGKAFMANYTKKGQTICGVYFDENGKYHDKGINVIFFVDEVEGKSGGGKTEHEALDKGLTLNVTLHKGKGWHTNNWCFNSIITLFHETFIHVDLDTKDYLDNKRIDNSNMPQDAKESAGGIDSHYQHRYVLLENNKNMGTKNSYWPDQAYNAFRNISKKWNLGYSNEYIWKAMWDSEGF
jgi:hypothetical protein